MRPVPPTDDQITTSLRENGGIVAHTAKMLGVDKSTIYRHIRKNPEMRKQLEEIQDESDDDLLEGSYIALKFNLANLKHAPRVALETAKYVIDYKGPKRGWIKQQAALMLNESQIDQSHIILQQQNEIRKLKEALKEQTSNDVQRQASSELLRSDEKA